MKRLAVIAVTAIAFATIGYMQAQDVGKAELVRPAPGSTLPGGTVTFASSEGQGVLSYGLFVGTSRGGSDLFRGLLGQALSVEVANLPTDGSTIHVRLHSRFDSGWEFNDYTFTAAAAPVEGEKVPALATAELVSPAPGSTLPGGTVTFAVSQGQSVLSYGLFVGTSRGGSDLFRGLLGQSLSVEVTNLPTDGGTIYVRLHSRFDSGWEFNDYTLTAATAPTEGKEAAALATAELVRPAPGSTLPGSTVTFAASEGQGVLSYGLFVGSSEGGSELFRGSLGQDLSVEVANLPTDGSTVYVRLHSRFASGWQSNDYKFAAAAAPTNGKAVAALAKAELVRPAPGSTLPGGTVTFASSEGQGVLGYGIIVGTSPGGSDLFRGVLGQALSVEVANLPTDGSTVFLRLHSRFDSGWEFNDYTLTAAGALTAPPATSGVTGGATGSAFTTYPEITDLSVLHGATLQTSDGTFLGIIIPGDESLDSICNDSGTYGSPFSDLSIRNQDSEFGTVFGDRSAFDPDASDPPLIFIEGELAARLSSSSLLTNTVGPSELLEFLGCPTSS